MSARIFVGNLDFKTTSEEIESLFSEAGEIQEVFLPSDRQTGRPRGFAFVEFADSAAAEAAIERFDGHELAGRALRVNMAEARPGFSRGFGGGRAPEGGGRGGRGAGKPKGSRRNLRGKKRSL